MFCVVAVLATLITVSGLSHAAEVVALGASNTYGKGVERGEDFPAQLEKILHAKGFSVTVTNAGVNGDTTAGMLARLDSVLNSDTKVLVIQPGGNDARKGGSDSDTQANVASIKATAAGRHIRVVMVPSGMFRGLPHQDDEIHLTPDGYHALAMELAPQVASALRH
ncbi:MAG: acyl-CoA thioesterase [Bradyrhizobium sp.]|nr:MAG: acyl-CoA thioesterase [Bradyrhizobium sp.]